MVQDINKAKTAMIRVLELCKDIERANAKLYEYFAEIYGSHPEMSDLWKKTASEEKNHALQFELAINLRREQFFDSLTIDGSAAIDMLNTVELLYDEARKNPPTMIESLRIAIKLEEDLANFHMTTVVNFSEECHKRLFNSMMKADQNHLEELRRFCLLLSTFEVQT